MWVRRSAIALSLGVGCVAIARPDTAANPLFGTMRLSSGFNPDPHVVVMRAGGDVDVQTQGLPSHCGGYIAPIQPDVRLVWASGTSTLRIAACSGTDTTLIVNDAHGNWHCADDVEGQNPVLEFRDGSGRYDIWVGAWSAGAARSAELRVTERDGVICD
jgi:hypothetical protein